MTGLLFLIALLAFDERLAQQIARPSVAAGRDVALATRIEQLVETFLTTDDDRKSEAALSEARGIFERDGVPTLADVGDSAAYQFVLITMLGQPPEFRLRFFAGVRKSAARQQLPADAVLFAHVRQRLTEIDVRYAKGTPSHPELRDQIEQLSRNDQAVRQKEGFDIKQMAEADRNIAEPLDGIFVRHGVPTYDMVGVQAARDFIVMVQHQSSEFRRRVLPKLKANVDAGQADPGMYAMVYDRTQRDRRLKQLYGEQLECSAGKTLELAPLAEPATVNLRRAKLGLMRLEIYTRLVRLHSPDVCGSTDAPG